MKKVYNYENATIQVLGVDAYDRESFKKATANFLKKVINGGKKDGNSDSSRNFRKE